MKDQNEDAAFEQFRQKMLDAKTGVLKPDQIPDTPEELAVITMWTVAKASLNALKNGRN